MELKTGDQVMVISGKDKGNLGKALNMVPELVRKAIS